MKIGTFVSALTVASFTLLFADPAPPAGSPSDGRGEPSADTREAVLRARGVPATVTGNSQAYEFVYADPDRPARLLFHGERLIGADPLPQEAVDPGGRSTVGSRLADLEGLARDWTFGQNGALTLTLGDRRVEVICGVVSWVGRAE